MIAKRIKTNLSKFRGTVHLYHLAPPLEGHEYVVVSAVDVPFSGPKTYIFGADSNGEVVNWGELEGSFRGDFDHKRALENAGYQVEEEE